MNVWKHSLLSERKFGGKAADYVHIHAFVDHSKLYLYHFKHRLLLHNLYGVELAMLKFGEVLHNGDGIEVMVRDLVVEHCKEDLSGKTPSIADWLREEEERLKRHFPLPRFDDETLEAFVLRPYLKSGLHASLMITMSDFGVGLVQQFLGLEAAKTLRARLPASATVAKYLSAVRFDQSWKYTPDSKELIWLKERMENGIRETGKHERVG